MSEVGEEKGVGRGVLFLFVSWSWKLGMLEIKPNYRENRDGGVTTKV